MDKLKALLCLYLVLNVINLYGQPTQPNLPPCNNGNCWPTSGNQFVGFSYGTYEDPNLPPPRIINFHDGIDIPCPSGTCYIRAIADGSIINVDVSSTGQLGVLFKLDNSNDVVSYGHIDQINPSWNWTSPAPPHLYSGNIASGNNISLVHILTTTEHIHLNKGDIIGTTASISNGGNFNYEHVHFAYYVLAESPHFGDSAITTITLTNLI